ERFTGLIGKKVTVPFVNREIPIVADEAVSTEFGTGAVKITPGHDPVDFEVGQRNNLPIINILNADVTMNENAGPYKGMDRFECRKAIVADLEKSGQLVKIEDYSHAVGHCQRCSTLVEPMVSMQWYVKIEPLAKPALDVVNNGTITIIPERFSRVYTNWMENIKDWCISRQLWWGHRIPVWYCRDCGEIMVEIDDPTACTKCGSKHIEQDPDTFDTWFSSGLWPHSTLGWPDDTADYEYFYPTSVMETAYDILFFWVARMIMLGIENTGKVPFHTVYLHGLIRDNKGEKMSKTKGNGIDPLVVMKEYGTDALRFAITTGIAPGGDSRLSDEKMEAGRNFANKLWNATRFVIRSIEDHTVELDIKKENLTVEDRWILSRLNRTIDTVNTLMKEYQFGEAERQIHDFLWNEYCDWYIELAKIRLSDDGNQGASPLPVLIHVLETSLRLLHPCMPFITEELWQQMKKRLPDTWQEKESIMVSRYPEADSSLIDEDSESIIESVVEIVRSIRNARAQYNVENSKWIQAQIYSSRLASYLTHYANAIQNLARAKPVTVVEVKEQLQSGDKVLAIVLKDSEVVIPMESMVDIEAEKRRLQKEIDENQLQADRLEARLNDKNFVEKAPAAVVEKERQKKDTIVDKIERLKKQLLK
ncbi:MAG: valine--tRNA ligase, partial [Dehalococcoidales bacterium]|nr:valine--tRNA ligase [Dehalococcoidales bacterium]